MDWCVHVSCLGSADFSLCGFGPDFVAGPQSHAGVTVLVLSPAQVRRLSGLACVLPRRDGIV